MVPRKPKLIAAAAVLALGICLAWPWKLGDTIPASVLPIATPTSAFEAVPTPANQPAPTGQTSAQITATPLGMTTAPPGELISTSRAAPPVTLANASPPAASDSSTASSHSPIAPPIDPPTRTHVVHEGDSLERLAERYLGSSGRAIEVFDLNREVLANPHVLAIGTELKIPDVGDSASAPVSP